MSRSARIPEVIQTSAMDCGPAALAALAQGFGLPVSYGRLREVCQTQVDGTSLERLGGVARQLGLDARQILLPREAVLRPEGEALPSLLMLRMADGRLHFVVGWSLLGDAVALMDPAEGRRTISTRLLEGQLHEAAFEMNPEAWRGWAVGPIGLGLVSAWMDALGLDEATQEALAERAFPAGWRATAALHTALRLSLRMLGEGLRLGSEAQITVVALFERALIEISAPEGPRHLAPEAWPAWPHGAGALVRGVPVLVVRGLLADRPALDPELARVLVPAARAPITLVVEALEAAEPRWRRWLAVALLALPIGGLLELLLLRGLVDIMTLSAAPAGRLGLGLAALALLFGLLGLRWGTAGLAQRLGRQIELRLRLALLHRLPRLPDRYLRSRPASDLAERAHSLHLLRELPETGLQIGRGLVDLALTVGVLAWMVPWTLPLSLGLVGGLALATRLTTRHIGDEAQRVGAAHGSLARIGLDALLGSTALRAHGSTQAIEAAQEEVLVELGRATRDLRDRGIGLAASTGAATSLGVGALLYLGATQGAGNLLFVLFALRLPGTVSGLASHFLSLPGLSTQLGRLLEPLETPEQEGADATGALEPGPAAISLRGVRVEAAGHRLLEVEALDIAAGEAIAIVGASGAGKSTLLGLLQGWHRPSEGLVTVNGAPLTPARVTALRARTAWVDPAVALWSRSLLDNLRYGDEGAVVDEGKVLEIAQLRPLLGRLPDGLATVAGEGGAGFSGGEGQRLRVGRGLRRPDPALVLLDEAFRGLDRPSRQRMAAEALARWQGATILMVSHDLDSCRAFPRVLVIEGGRIVEDGAPADLLTQGGAFARLVSAEADLQSQRWTDPAWRRWRVGEGRVTS